MLWFACFPVLASVFLFPFLGRVNAGGPVAPPFPVAVRAVVTRSVVPARYVSLPVRLPALVVAVAALVGVGVVVWLGSGLLAGMVGIGVWVAIVASYTDVTQFRIPRPVTVVAGALLWLLLLVVAASGAWLPLVVSVLMAGGYAVGRRRFSTAGGGDHNLIYALLPVFVAGLLGSPWWVVVVAFAVGMVVLVFVLVAGPALRNVRVSRVGEVPLAVAFVVRSSLSDVVRIGALRGERVPAGPWISTVAVTPAVVSVFLGY